MSIVINGSGTVTGLAVGGLPDGTVDAGTVAADVATQAEIDVKLNLAGGTMTGDVSLGDSVKAKFGAGDDLQIYHDGSHSYIADVGTGDLTIRAGNDLRLQDSNTQAYLTGNEGGSVEIYYNNSKKLETTSSGIDVTGSVITSDKVRIVNDTSSKIELGDSGNTSIGKIEYVHSSNDLFFKVNDAERMRIDSSGNVSIGATTSGNYKFLVSGAQFNVAEFKRTNNYGAIINVTNGTGTSLSMGMDDDEVRYLGSSTTKYLDFGSSGSNANFHGNVGIGTASPSFPLHVSGKIYSTGVVSSGGNSFELSDNNVTIKRATDDMTLNTAGTERIRINANGNIGIGESTPIRKVVIAGSSGNSSTLLLHMDADTAGGETALQFKADSTNDDRRVKASIVFRRDNPGTRGTGKLYFNVNGDNNDVNVSTSHAGLVIDANRRIHGGSYTFETGHLNLIGEYGQSYKAMTFSRTNGGGVVGSIVANSSSTSYNTSSDYRLKENVDYDWNATTRLKQLKPARFNWIKDDTNTLVDGFLAHEVSSIVPEAITGDKDAMKDEQYIVTPAVEEVKDANGNITTEAKEAVISTRNVPDYQSIDQAKLVPLLVKTIQELEARITALEA